jgi:hypothetical protein
MKSGACAGAQGSRLLATSAKLPTGGDNIGLGCDQHQHGRDHERSSIVNAITSRRGGSRPLLPNRARQATSVSRLPHTRVASQPGLTDLKAAVLSPRHSSRATSLTAPISAAPTRSGVLGVLEELVLEELGNAQKVRIGGLVQLTVRVKPAQKGLA